MFIHSAYPLFYFSLFFAAGIFTAVFCVRLWLLIIVCLLMLGVFMYVRQKKMPADIVLVLVFFLLGGARFFVYPRAADNVFAVKGNVRMRGRVVSEVKESYASYGALKTAFDMRVTDADIPEGLPKHLKVRVIWYKDARDNAAVRYGDTISFYAKERPRKKPVLSGGFDYYEYLRRRGVSGIFILDKKRGVSVEAADNKRMFTRFLFNMKRELSLRLLRSKMNRKNALLLQGLLLGRKEAVYDEMRETFKKTGTLHVLAVSGLHIGIISLLIIGGCGLLRINKRIVYAAVIIFLMVYCAFLGFSPSVVRAALMVSVYLFGRIIYRRADIRNSLGCSVLIMLMIRPSELFETGFQLSFAAVCSIIFLYPNIRRYLSAVSGECGRTLNYFMDVFAVSASCWLGLLPFMVMFFHRVSIYGIFANCFIVPLVPVLLIGGVLQMLFSHSLFGDMLAGAADVFIGFVMKVLWVFREMPFSYIHVKGMDVWWVMLYVFTVVSIIFCDRFSPVKKRVCVKIIALLFMICFLHSCIFIPGKNISELDDEEIKLTLCVDGGESLLFIERMNSFSYYDRKYILEPFLVSEGTENIDYVCLKDSKYMNRYFFREFLRDWKVKKIFLPSKDDLLAWNRFEFAGPDAFLFDKVFERIYHNYSEKRKFKEMNGL